MNWSRHKHGHSIEREQLEMNGCRTQPQRSSFIGQLPFSPSPHTKHSAELFEASDDFTGFDIPCYPRSKTTTSVATV
jgi:hypothetical protein